MPSTPPDGFAPFDRKSPMTDPWEPLYACKRYDRIVLGLTVDTPHTNSRGFLHGGLIAALADNAMGHSCGQVLRAEGQAPDGLVTVSLAVDYLGRAAIGDWLAIDTDFVRTGRSLCFAGAVITANGAPVARAHATFKLQVSKG